jgi:hypothetical protein
MSEVRVQVQGKKAGFQCQMVVCTCLSDEMRAPRTGWCIMCVEQVQSNPTCAHSCVHLRAGRSFLIDGSIGPGDTVFALFLLD